ncbi:metal ABC transporter solute-binding protein, Zn/Mn family [Phormidium sp. CCY1219]|uniref:metal ABC transporter solute-binding protein, Zn/Mn family n=1 Tax=Phormidium sp. CCY1219 TaxID=2886104 RepID=UPI002D1E908B|nr:zinc ABC transporter substrate-binding protein [Phormidium sp. CCY1219]MEB3831826.1 zinc ABC transporter substrate-binding protein [Phormidium sp. CCY1219]
MKIQRLFWIHPSRRGSGESETQSPRRQNSVAPKLASTGRMKPWRVAIAVLCFAVVPLEGCQQNPKSELRAQTDPLDIAVSILPQKYFVQRVGGENVRVNVLVEPGASPATYEPKPSQLRALSEAEAYFRIRVPFENAWMDKIQAANPQMRLVDTTQDIERMPMSAHSHHGSGGHQQDANPDPHVWLSPALVKIQAQTIYDTLAELDPPRQAEYRQNLERFIADIGGLEAEIRASLANLQQRKFMVFHPAWGYFAREYDLEMIPIEIGGTEPSAAEMAQLIARAKQENIQVIFAQPQFSTKAAETIANEIGGEVILINPLAPDWLENLGAIASTFSRVLSEGRSTIRVGVLPFPRQPRPVAMNIR